MQRKRVRSQPPSRAPSTGISSGGGGCGMVYGWKEALPLNQRPGSVPFMRPFIPFPKRTIDDEILRVPSVEQISKTVLASLVTSPYHQSSTGGWASTPVTKSGHQPTNWYAPHYFSDPNWDYNLSVPKQVSRTPGYQSASLPTMTSRSSPAAISEEDEVELADSILKLKNCQA